MTDQFPTDKAREIVAAMRASMRRDGDAYPDAEFLADMSGYIRDLESLLRSLPALADMTEEEQNGCRRMQADTEYWGRAVILAPNVSRGRALLLDEEANVIYAARELVTPRPDLPRLEWPGTEKAAPAPAPALPEGWRLADHPDHGRGVVTTPTPNRDGRVYFVIPADDLMGYDLLFCTPDGLTYLDQEADQ